MIEGNPGKRKIPEPPPLAPIAPDEPDWKTIFPGNRKGVGDLRADARSFFRSVVDELEPLGILAGLDWSTLIDASVAWAQMREATRDLAVHGATQDTSDRGRTKNPAATTLNQARTQFRFYVAELGLSPSSRGRVSWAEGFHGSFGKDASAAGGHDLLD